MGFATVDTLINAASVNNTMQRLSFSKTTTTTVANQPWSLWTGTGVPAAGTYGTNGKANGRSTDQTTVGAYKYGNAASGTMHLITMGSTTVTASGSGSLILVDRMADCQLSHAETTGAITGMDASTRMAATTAPGDGGMLWCEVTSVFSTASNTITYQATDQLGNTAQNLTGMVTNPGAAALAANRSVNAQLWQTLASGITSIRALTNTTLTAGSATGQYAACIVRPLGIIPIVAVSQYVERDFVVEIPNIIKLYDNSCLTFIYITTVAATTPTVFGELRICYN